MNLNTEIFHRIAEAAKKNTLTFFVGAGVSKLSGVPKWSELIDAFCDELGIPKKPSYNSEDYLAIPQKYFYSISQDTSKYYEFVEKNILSADSQPNIVHRMMCTIKPQSFITTNFDNLLESAVIQNCLTYKTIACDKDIASINGDNFILKVHGDIVHKNIVLKEEDYLNYNENYKLTETFLKSIFSTNTVVFIGYGLNDYNIKLILNWSKTLLKEFFNKPIFIYTDDDELSKIDFVYHESKGLSIIDFRDCLDDTMKSANIDYATRYTSVLKKIISCSIKNIEGKDKYELFETIYDLLKPLNSLKALKTTDLNKQLSPFLIVVENGEILPHPDKPNLMELFCEYNNDKSFLLSAEKKQIAKYNTIREIFQKARITHYRLNENIVTFKYDKYEFADSSCILFDYLNMNKVVQKTTNNLYSQFKYAFYLAKLKRYKESFFLIKQVTVDAYRKKDYLIYYLAQINKINVYKAMKNVNKSIYYFNTFSFDDLDELDLENSSNERVFENLPIEFKNEYSIFSDLYSVSSLYKNAYESFLESAKIENAIDNRTCELGFTSAHKGICRINNNLHFFLGNNLFIDEFAEFKTTIKSLMSLLIYKFSTQSQERITDTFTFNFKESCINFDEIDFYCLIEYFTDKEIDELMKKYNIEEIPFQNRDKINLAIRNLFNYYDKVLSTCNNFIEVIPYQCKLKTCLKLLKYVSIPTDTVEFVTNILLKYEFREILINDKILFIDAQIYKKEAFNKKIQNLLLKTLIKYIDMEISCFNAGKKFELHSSSTGISYWNLAYYLSPMGEYYVSKKLSDKVMDIMCNYQQFSLYDLKACYDHINKKAQKKMECNIRGCIDTKFNFDLFSFLIIKDKTIRKADITKLKKHLYDKIESTKKDPEQVEYYPKNDPYEDLTNVGYWCLLGILSPNDFAEFLGKNDKFDFFFAPEEFNYDKFDITWLMNLRKETHRTITKYSVAKKSIQSCICIKLKNCNMEKHDKEYLITILFEYYS